MLIFRPFPPLFCSALCCLLLLPFSSEAEYRRMAPPLNTPDLSTQEPFAWGSILLIALGLSIVLGLLGSMVFALGGPLFWLQIALISLLLSLVLSGGVLLLGSSHPHSGLGLFVGIALIAFWLSLLLQGIPLFVAGLLQGLAWVTALGAVTMGLPLLALIFLVLW